ncbi:MAG: DUF6020 family protein [bacterium]|nr:DUF6020 family protein [bacterium]
MSGLYRKHKLWYLFYIMCLTFVTSCALGLSLGKVSLSKGTKATGVYKVILQLQKSYKNDSTNDLFVLLLLGIVLFFLVRREYSRRSRRCSLVFSIGTSILLLLGRAFYRKNNLDDIFASRFTMGKALIIVVGYCIIIYYIVNACMEYVLPKLKASSFIKKFAPKRFKVSIWTCFAAIVIAWLPYVIATYPCNFTPDARDEVAQFLGDETICKTYRSIIYPEEAKTLLNNHHPITYTIVIGTFAKVGLSIGNITIAMFSFTMLQMLFLAFVYSYTVNYIKKLEVPIIFQLLTLGFFMFYPVIPMYALTITKDSLYGGFMILVTIQLFKLIRSEDEIFYSKKERCILFFSLLGFMLLRNNGFYIGCVLLVVLLIKYRKSLSKLKDIGLLIGIPIVLYGIVLLKIVLPLCNIPEGSPREMLSVPFQQVARYAVEWGEEGFDDGEIETLNKILCFDNDLEVLKKRYDPIVSDGVKNHFNKYYTKEELKEFMVVWAKLLVRHPGTYVTATLNNISYYYSVDYGKGIVYNGTGSPGAKFGLRNPAFTNAPRKMIITTINALKDSSMLGWAFSVGPWNYLFLICIVYMVYTRQYRYALMTMPVVLNLLIAIAGPVAYMRYAIEWIVVLPLFGAMVWICLEETAKKSKLQ